jgi:hypothetical protein
MKNIHVLPTPKPSRIYLIKSNNKLGITSNNPEFTENFGSGTQNQHIYITSNKEIKVYGDWYYNTVTNAIFQMKYLTEYNPEQDKKIVLSTDQDLINDGVQAIDDEFLQWFVKNPSCDSVEVTKVVTFKKNNEVYVDEITGGNYYEVNKQYKIIIPKEEPKQETLEEAAERYFPSAEKIGGETYTAYKGFIAGAKHMEKKMLELMDSYADDVMGGCTLRAKEWFEQLKNK